MLNTLSPITASFTIQCLLVLAGHLRSFTMNVDPVNDTIPLNAFEAIFPPDVVLPPIEYWPLPEIEISRTNDYVTSRSHRNADSCGMRFGERLAYGFSMRSDWPYND